MMRINVPCVTLALLATLGADAPNLAHISQLARVGSQYEDVTQHFTGALEPSWETLDLNGKTVVFGILHASAPINGNLYDVLLFDENGDWLGSELSPSAPLVDSKGGFVDIRYSADGPGAETGCCKGDYADLLLGISNGRAALEARGYGPYLNNATTAATHAASIVGTSAGNGGGNVVTTRLASIEHLVFDQTGGLWAADRHEIIFIDADARRIASRRTFAPCAIADVAGMMQQAAVLLSCGRVAIVSRDGTVRDAGTAPAGTRFIVATGDRLRTIAQRAGIVSVASLLPRGSAAAIAARIPWQTAWAGALGDRLLLYDATRERVYAVGTNTMAPVCDPPKPVSAVSMGGYENAVAMLSGHSLEIAGARSCALVGAFPALHPAAFALSNTLLAIAFADANIVLTAVTPPN